MRFHEDAIADLCETSPIGQWPAARTALEAAAAKHPRAWALPLIGAAAVGGSADQALPGVQAIACLMESIILVDDLLDDDPRGAFLHLGVGRTANLAMGLQAAGLEAIERSRANRNRKQAALACLNAMMIATARGQALDVKGVSDERAYWKVVDLKSASFYAAALQVGAILGGGDDRTVTAIRRFGEAYGVMIQIHDDLNDVMASPANPDWIQGRSPLPILFAQCGDRFERARFADLRRAISVEPAALAAAQQFLIDCGAVSYCLYQLVERERAAQALLDDVHWTDADGLQGLLDEALQPVLELSREAGIEPLPDRVRRGRSSSVGQPAIPRSDPESAHQ